MSSEQLLLTLGVALLVFDAKKIPKLLANIAMVMATWQKCYARIALQFDKMIQQEMNQRQLEINQKKAAAVESSETQQ